MGKYVAFIRAINVAGHASVKMTDLKAAFASAGCRDVRTYVQSGNVLFETPDNDTATVFGKVAAELRKLIGGEPTVLFRTLRQIQRIAKMILFKDLEGDSDVKLYVVFLAQKPQSKPSLPLLSPKEALEAIGVSTLEVFVVSHRMKHGFYGFPNNFIEKELGVLATSRNWSTVTRIAELSQ